MYPLLLPQVDLTKAKSAVEQERRAREDASAAVAKLEGAVHTVRKEMIEAQEASNKVGEGAAGVAAGVPTTVKTQHVQQSIGGGCRSGCGGGTISSTSSSSTSRHNTAAAAPSARAPPQNPRPGHAPRAGASQPGLCSSCRGFAGTHKQPPTNATPLPHANLFLFRRHS